jgi:DNA-binding GntR family transcriptional regulator
MESEMAAVEEALEFERQNGSRAELAYLRLREQIIRVELAPGTVLREDELTQRLGTGRTPVREALQRLQRDGFVTVLPRRGTLVAEINITDLAAIYEVRMRLESWASRLAAERVTEPDRAEARRLSDELAAVAGDDYEALLTLDRRVHRFVYRCAKNPFLAETLDQYHNLSLRILHVAMKRYPALTPRLEDVVHEQRTVLDAIVRGDGDTAERVAIAHISTFERAIREVI